MPAQQIQSAIAAVEVIEDMQLEADKCWDDMLRRWERVLRVLQANTIEDKDQRWSQFKQRYSEPLFKDFLD
ncbi:hypothetical protein N7509_009952 [Penicillium cosmopolitanum]|uniref:Uncharacterized protein n=1 Tax=Penicillium cosmopolitanum TaxID=1131564 RepID=A0A9X0B459_9EURO|nr:uncharacterized protein N7509_009952 [Penicillium cosmopolitanum]KAJ5387411.1 hypothetical protein N7509_009952 [Penicillium cosmopolitanum]